MDALEFQPGVASGGQLSQEAYSERKRICTAKALTSLHTSLEFKQWNQKRRRQRILAAATSFGSAIVAAAIVISTVLLIYGFFVQAPATLTSFESSAEPSQQPGYIAATVSNQELFNSGLEVKEPSVQDDDLVDALAAALQRQRQLEHEVDNQRLQQEHEVEEFRLHFAQMSRLLQQEQAQVAALGHQLSIAQADFANILADNSALQQQVSQQEATISQFHNEANIDSSAAMSKCSSILNDETCPNQPHLSINIWSQLYVTYAIASVAMFGFGAIWRLHCRQSAVTTTIKDKADQHGEDSKVLVELELATHKVNQMTSELQALKDQAALDMENAARVQGSLIKEKTTLQADLDMAREELCATVAKAEEVHQEFLQEKESMADQLNKIKTKAVEYTQRADATQKALLQEKQKLLEQLELAKDETTMKATEAERAHQAMLQVQVDHEEQLQLVKTELASKVELVEQVQHQLEEEREWRNVAQQLAAFTANALPTSMALKGFQSAANSPVIPVGSPHFPAGSPRSTSPTKRTPFGPRGRSNKNLRDENSPVVASPLGPGSLTPPSIAAAAGAVISNPDNPQAWLQQLQSRFCTAKEQATSAERSAMEADAAWKDAIWNQDKRVELMTDNELLKERLADAKRHFQTAAAGEAQAREAVAAMQARLDELQVKEKEHLQEQSSLQQQLQAAQAEQQKLQGSLDDAMACAQSLQQRLAESEQTSCMDCNRFNEYQQQLSEKEAEVAELNIAVTSLERENSSLEAQADQVTESLMHTQQQKSLLEKKVSELEQEVASLNIMAEKLEEDKAVLEEQLVEARRAQADICKAGKQLAAAETTIRESTMMSMSNGGNTPDTDIDLRRAIQEKVLALDMLASAEKRMIEKESAYDMAPLALPSPLGLSSRSTGHVDNLYGNTTPISRGAKFVSYFSTKLDKVAKLMAGEQGAESPPLTPRSQGSRSSSIPGRYMVQGNMSAWVDHLSQSFSTVGKVLHQDLTDSESPRIPAYDNALFVQDGGVDKTQEALQYSASEIHEILAALDYAEQMQGSNGTFVAAARNELHAAHMEVQAAMREVQSCSTDIALRKSAHHEIKQEVEQLSGQVQIAEEMMQTEMQKKAQTAASEHIVQQKLSNVEKDLEVFIQEQQAAFSEQFPNVDLSNIAEESEAGKLWEVRLHSNERYQRCVNQQRMYVEELRAALVAKTEAVNSVATASAKLGEAEVRLEDASGKLDLIEADLNSLTHQKLHLTGVLQHQQARQADALQAAVGALDQCLSPEEAGTGSSEPNEGHSIKQGSEVPESGPHVKRIVINEVVIQQTRARSPAEVAEQLLEQGWSGRSCHSVPSTQGSS